MDVLKCTNGPGPILYVLYTVLYNVVVCPLVLYNIRHITIIRKWIIFCMYVKMHKYTHVLLYILCMED